MLRVVLMGPPGAGKGTQGARLARYWGVPHIASGDILRHIAATEGSELAGYAPAGVARVINQGQLIPDAVANAVVFRALDKPETAPGFVLDGYPRDVAQAEALDGYLLTRAWSLDAAVELRIAEEALVARLMGRLTCPNCGESYHVRDAPPRVAGVCDRCGDALKVREDDHPERIRTRFALYHQKTKPLVDFYRERGLLRFVDASGAEDAVFAAILQALSGGAKRENLV